MAIAANTIVGTRVQTRGFQGAESVFGHVVHASKNTVVYGNVRGIQNAPSFVEQDNVVAVLLEGIPEPHFIHRNRLNYAA